VITPPRNSSKSVLQKGPEIYNIKLLEGAVATEYFVPQNIYSICTDVSIYACR
jgi:hypothetical protein